MLRHTFGPTARVTKKRKDGMIAGCGFVSFRRRREPKMLRSRPYGASELESFWAASRQGPEPAHCPGSW